MTLPTINPSVSDAVSDFEFLAVLAKNNPAEFEKIREKIIQEFIDSSDDSKQKMLVRFQWRIDQTRKQAKNPLHAFIKLSQMMWQSLDDLVAAQNQLVRCVRDQEPIVENEFELVDLMEFKKRNR